MKFRHENKVTGSWTWDWREQGCSPMVRLTENNRNTIHMYPGITSGRVLDGELLYTKILEVNLFAC